MKRTPPRSRLLWSQPARRTVWPACSARRSLQVWERYGLADMGGKLLAGTRAEGKHNQVSKLPKLLSRNVASVAPWRETSANLTLRRNPRNGCPEDQVNSAI